MITHTRTRTHSWNACIAMECRTRSLSKQKVQYLLSLPINLPTDFLPLCSGLSCPALFCTTFLVSPPPFPSPPPPLYIRISNRSSPPPLGPTTTLGLAVFRVLGCKSSVSHILRTLQRGEFLNIACSPVDVKTVAAPGHLSEAMQWSKQQVVAGNADMAN